jgi:hypothetical protein
MSASNEYESDKTSLRPLIVVRHLTLMSMISMKCDSIPQRTSWRTLDIECAYEPKETFQPGIKCEFCADIWPGGN